jgi:hypothetical protein
MARGAGLAAAALPLLLAATVLLGLFLNLGAMPLFDVDEGAFGEATREMLERGDYVSTWLNGQPRYDKPILIYWLQAASVRLLGLRRIRAAPAVGAGGQRLDRRDLRVRAALPRPRYRRMPRPSSRPARPASP